MSTRDVERDAARLVRVRGRWYRDASASASRAASVTREEARARAKRTANDSRDWRRDADFRRADDDDDGEGEGERAGETVDDDERVLDARPVAELARHERRARAGSELEEAFASVESWTIRPARARDFDGVVRV